MPLHERAAVADRMATIGSIAAGAAHDLCAPVGSALAALDEAARLARAHAAALGEGGASLLGALEDARVACEQIRHVSRDLRAFSRADDRPPESAVADVTAVLDAAARMAAHELRDRARVVRSYAPVPAVCASVPRLGQVFLNLLVNAAQAIAPGAPERNEVRLRAAPAPDGRVAVEIEDTGAGIAPEVWARLFTPFFTTKPEGTGLGLTICQRIVRELGGTLELASEPGRGTRVRVLLPAAPPARVDAAPAPVAEGAAPARPRVLVVDDETSVHRAMARLLGKTCDVACADPAAAVARLERGERFDLVLCDLSMPGMSGPELRRRALALDPGQAARFVFLSGGAPGDASWEQGGLDGAPVMDKAARPDELRAAIEARLRAVGGSPGGA